VKVHPTTAFVVVIGFATSLGGFLADEYRGVSFLLGIGLTLAFAGVLDIALIRRDQALRLVHELEVRNVELDQARSREARAEESLQRARRTEAVGQLAGGIAHDFNNLLQAILSYSEFLADALTPESPLLEDLAEIQKAARRAAGLTRQLLVFSRHHAAEPVVLDLNASVRNAERLLRSTLGEDIRLVCETPSEPCLVLADPGELELMLMNLAVNARDAMPCGGDMSVTVDTVEIREGDGAARNSHTGHFARLGIQDSGKGMTPSAAAQAFESFAGSNETGRGAGLGLAMVHGIASRAGGSATISSIVGMGTSITVLLPLSIRETHLVDHTAVGRLLESSEVAP